MTDGMPDPRRCATCRFNEPHRYILAGRWTDDRRCFHHIMSYPNATSCERYEREPGSDE
jgi:hypothetical protein